MMNNSAKMDCMSNFSISNKLMLMQILYHNSTYRRPPGGLGQEKKKTCEPNFSNCQIWRRHEIKVFQNP